MTNSAELVQSLIGLSDAASKELAADGVALANQKVAYEIDMRFAGQGLSSLITIPVTLDQLRASDGFAWLQSRLEEGHKRAFTFTFDDDHEIVNLRTLVEGKQHGVRLPKLAAGGPTPPAEAKVDEQVAFYGGRQINAAVYERLSLLAGNRIEGPAIILDMDATALVTVGCVAEIDEYGMIVINPSAGDIPRHVIDSDPDQITMEVLEKALEATRYEMDAVVFRTAMSPGIREQHDQFPVIAAPDGKMVMGQFGSFIPAFLRTYKESLHDGDVILLNNPYSCDGAVSHLNDWLVLAPIYDDNSVLLGWGSMFGHMTDVGGMSKCSMPNDAQELFQEGLIIPPVKLYSKGQFNKDLHDMILSNVRKPEWNKCDLRGLVASVEVCKIRMREFAKRFGTKTWLKTLDMMLERNRNATHEIIKTQVSEDTLYFEDYVCDDGQGFGPYKLACTMKKVIQANEDHHVVFDFSPTDPQSPGSINFFLNKELFKMFVGSYICAVFDPQMTFNDGFYPLLEVIHPKGTLLNPYYPAALSCRTHVLGRVFDILGGLLGQRAPNFMCAAGFSDSPHLQYYGPDDGTGKPFMYYGIVFGGIPGKPFGDGVDGHSLWPSFTNVPNEFMERYFPIRVEICEAIPDSGGAGFFRGGNGVRLVYRILADGAVNIHDDRWLIKPFGVNGGLPAQGSEKFLYRACKEGELTSAVKELVPSKCDKYPLKAGDVLHYITWGGGGFGHPFEREASLVQRDVRRGLVSPECAAKNYGVILVGDTAEIDVSATEKARVALKIAAPTGEAAIFNFGWKKNIKATADDLARLRATCEEATGYKAPVPRPKFEAPTRTNSW
jgi:N-methylhydantoinase B